MYKVRLEGQNSINYDIFDEAELIVGSICFNKITRRWVVQLMGEIEGFVKLSAAIKYILR